jgi:transcriptional regulator with XRE-family HTH domain
MELRRVRNFLGLSQILVSVATGISVYRLSGAENGYLQLNSTERRALEQFYQQKLKILAEVKRTGGGE